jgi:exodeoxyribonuclease-3
MKQQKCQILFIQETHFVKENINKINQNCDANCYHSFGNSNSRCVSILISNQVEYSIIDTHQDSEGRILILNIELDNKKYTLVNIYAPNHVKERYVNYRRRFK